MTKINQLVEHLNVNLSREIHAAVRKVFKQKDAKATQHQQVFKMKKDKP